MSLVRRIVDGMARMRIFHDDQFGTVAAAIGFDGEILATGSAGHSDGIYMVKDEAALYQLTGELIPAPVWDACVE